MHIINKELISNCFFLVRHVQRTTATILVVNARVVWVLLRVPETAAVVSMEKTVVMNVSTIKPSHWTRRMHKAVFVTAKTMLKGIIIGDDCTVTTDGSITYVNNGLTFDPSDANDASISGSGRITYNNGNDTYYSHHTQVN